MEGGAGNISGVTGVVVIYIHPSRVPLYEIQVFLDPIPGTGVQDDQVLNGLALEILRWRQPQVVPVHGDQIPGHRMNVLALNGEVARKEMAGQCNGPEAIQIHVGVSDDYSRNALIPHGRLLLGAPGSSEDRIGPGWDLQKYQWIFVLNGRLYAIMDNENDS